MKSLLFLGLTFAMLCSCSSKKGKLLTEITSLQNTADSVQTQLAGINSEKVKNWYSDYLALKQELIVFGAQDTIPLEISETLDNYLSTISELEFISEELEYCKSANDSLKIRLGLLKTDIENQSGDRSQYNAFLKKEMFESEAIRKHAEILSENYISAETAVTQFLPEIERFIRTFVIQ